MKAKSWGVRWWAIDALLNIGDRKALPTLVKAIKDKNGRVRQWAVTALGQIGDSQVLPYLQEVLDKKEAKSKQDKKLRETAIKAISDIEEQQPL